MRALLMAWLITGCVEERPYEQARIYTCTITYRCLHDVNITARIALPCAVDLFEANEMATTAGYQAVEEDCPDSWQYVRPLCAPYEPLTACQ